MWPAEPSDLACRYSHGSNNLTVEEWWPLICHISPPAKFPKPHMVGWAEPGLDPFSHGALCPCSLAMLPSLPLLRARPHFLSFPWARSSSFFLWGCVGAGLPPFMWPDGAYCAWLGTGLGTPARPGLQRDWELAIQSTRQNVRAPLSLGDGWRGDTSHTGGSVTSANSNPFG